MVEFIYLILCLILIIAPIGTFFHELGHSIAARTVHANEITLMIGKGKKILSFRLININVEVYFFFFIGGHTVSSRSPFYKKEELVYISIMGPLANGVIALLLFIYGNDQANIYIELAFWYNIWLFLVNILPINYSGKYTDGYLVYKILFKGIE